MAIYYSRSARETENIGFSLAKTVEVGSVVALFGELGAGKTPRSQAPLLRLSTSTVRAKKRFAILICTV